MDREKSIPIEIKAILVAKDAVPQNGDEIIIDGKKDIVRLAHDSYGTEVYGESSGYICDLWDNFRGTIIRRGGLPVIYE